MLDIVAPRQPLKIVGSVIVFVSVPMIRFHFNVRSWRRPMECFTNKLVNGFSYQYKGVGNDLYIKIGSF